MRFLTYTFIALAAIISACDGANGRHQAEYSPFDSVPYNVETNMAAKTYMLKTFPGSYLFRSEYPQYHSIVRLGLVELDDTANIKKVIANHFDRMANRIGIYESKIRAVDNAPGFHGWVMVTPECGAPVQMIVTDSATMMLHATMEFTSPQTDSANVIYPAIEAIASDMEHMIKHLTPVN